jgi:hypothetical protein
MCYLVDGIECQPPIADGNTLCTAGNTSGQASTLSAEAMRGLDAAYAYSYRGGAGIEQRSADWRAVNSRGPRKTCNSREQKTAVVILNRSGESKNGNPSGNRRRTGMRSNRLNELALLWNGWLDAHWRRYLIAASTLSLLTFSGYAHVRPLLSDDVLAMIVMRQASAGAIWRALKGGIQVDPPVIDTAVHFVFRLFGEHWYLAEFPAIASFTLLCVCVSLLVKRHAPPVYAAAAFFFPYATLVRGWAMQVRPYAAMMGCSALALVLLGWHPALVP